MKKIILIGMILVLMSVFALAGNYNPETYEYTWELKEGWNLVPMINTFPPAGYSNTADFFSQCDLGYFFMWNPIQKEYFGWNTSTSDTIGTPVSQTDILSTNYIIGSHWVYSNTNCSLSNTYGTYPMSWDESTKDQVASSLKLVEGWNFVAINPFMIGMNTKDIFNNCDLSGMNYWQSVSQTWSSSSSTAFAQSVVSGAFDEMEGPIVNAMVGQTWVVKVSSDCYLNYSSNVTGPPALPN